VLKYLTSKLWAEQFEPHILQLGQKLSKENLLNDIRLEATESSDFILTAQVSNEGELEEVEVAFWKEEWGWDFESTCSCNSGGSCIHVAALLFAASKTTAAKNLISGRILNATTVDGINPTEKTKPKSTDENILTCTPEFSINLLVEPVTSRTIKLLLQGLRMPQSDTWLVARPMVHYGDHELPLQTTGDSRTTIGDLTIQRDTASERHAAALLQQAGLTSISAQASYRFLLALDKKKRTNNEDAYCWFPEPQLTTPKQYWPWFRSHAARQLIKQGWSVNFDSNFGHEILSLTEREVVPKLEECNDGWFDLSVGIEHNGETYNLIPLLADLLASERMDELRERKASEPFLLYLPKGGAIELAAGRLRVILHQLASFITPGQSENPKIHPLDAAALSAQQDLHISAPKSLKKYTHSPSTDADLKNIVPPTDLQATLRDYQLDGFRWMHFLLRQNLHGILADDMGLGKTIQTLAFLLDQQKQGNATPSLIVAPTSVVFNWAAEAQKFTPALKVLTYQGSKRKRSLTVMEHADIVITSYAILQRDIGELEKKNFHLIALDEAQYIKNAKAKVTQAAYRLNGKFRLCLSGTPIENNLGELWSLMRFLLPDYLGSEQDFKLRYRDPIEKDEDEERQQMLNQRLAPLILRRTKDQVATELPPKTIMVHPIDLSTYQRDIYETVRATMDKKVREAIAARGINQSQIVFLDALLKLRQICCDPILLKTRDEQQKTLEKRSAKLAYLMDLLEILSKEKRRVLIFSQFTTMLDLIAQELTRMDLSYLLLTGNTKDRGALVKKFQNSKIPVFLISLKAGGTGLNLTAADTVIHYDPWWNPAAENQATDRAYRIGQDKPVFVHKLICSGTVEERIQALQAKKSALADALLGNSSKSSSITQEQIEELLKP